MIGNLPLADDVLQARHLVREDPRQQVLAAHALQLRRHLAPAAVARQGQRGGGVPAPAHAKQRCVEQGLDQHMLGAAGVQVAPHLVEREAVAGGEREDDGVLGGRRLQLEIEVAAETLAQRQPPGAIDPAAERRVDDQLHAAGFVEETLQRQAVLRRQHAEGGARAGQVFGDLQGRFLAKAEFAGQPVERRLQRLVAAGALLQQLVEPLAQTRHADGQLVTPPRRLAQPERDVRRLPLGVLDPHPPRLDAQDAIGHIAELEHVASQAFHREVLVHRADHQPLRLQQHAVVAGIGNGSAGGHGGQPGATPAAHLAVHHVAMQVGAALAGTAGVALGEHAQQAVERDAGQVGVRLCAGQQVEQLVLLPFAAGHFGNDLLGQHIQRRMGDRQGVQLAPAHTVEQRRAFDQVVPRGGEQPPLRRAADAVAGAPDPLQESGDGARRADLADQLDVADIDAQFQRSGRHQHLELAAFQTLLGAQPELLRQAAVVRRHLFAAEAFGQMAGDAFGQPPRVDEHQRGAVLAGQRGEAVVDGVPDFVGHHRLQRRGRHLDGQVAGAAVADIDDAAGLQAGMAGADQEVRHRLDGFLRGGQADAHQRRRAQRLQALQRQGQVAAALAAGQRVDLVDDHAARPGQHRPPGLRAEQHVERFRRGDEDVRRLAAHRLALTLGGVAGAHRGADIHLRQARSFELVADASQRLFQVDADVVGQRLERRDVDHRRAIRQLAAMVQPFAHQFVDGGEESGERLARTGGRGDQRRTAVTDRRPGQFLGAGRRGEMAAEPGGDRRVEVVQHGAGGGREGIVHAFHYGGGWGRSQGRSSNQGLARPTPSPRRKCVGRVQPAIAEVGIGGLHPPYDRWHGGRPHPSPLPEGEGADWRRDDAVPTGNSARSPLPPGEG
ncbi:hypothetical protein D3C78_714450 [compost metagenome]